MLPKHDIRRGHGRQQPKHSAINDYPYASFHKSKHKHLFSAV
jgi:hypothetical protein